MWDTLGLAHVGPEILMDLVHTGPEMQWFLDSLSMGLGCVWPGSGTLWAFGT